jgi:hypothetical protein
MPVRIHRHKLLVSLAAAVLLAVGLAGVSLVGASSPASAAPADAAGAASATSTITVPPEIAVPPGNSQVAQFGAFGVQVYQCAAGSWSFLEPAAQLFDLSGQAAIHFRGPSWESVRDGSLVQAKAIASSPVPGSIPQLLLQATSTRGNGIFGAVTYVQRLATSGGVAPTTACTDGQTQGVPYTAVYRFYVAS